MKLFKNFLFDSPDISNRLRRLEESKRDSKFAFDSVDLLHCK